MLNIVQLAQNQQQFQTSKDIQQSQFNTTQQNVNADNYRQFLSDASRIPSADQISGLSDADLMASREYQNLKSTGMSVQQFRSDLTTAAQNHDLARANTSSLMDARTQNAQLAADNYQLKVDKANSSVVSPNDIKTTLSGSKYVDLSQFKGTDQFNKAREEAYRSGAVPLSANDVAVSQSIDSVKSGLQTIRDEMISAGLAKTDSIGRVIGFATTPLNKIFQKNPTLAAMFNANGTLALGVDVAVNSLRTIAGSSSFRMTAGEIDKCK